MIRLLQAFLNRKQRRKLRERRARIVARANQEQSVHLDMEAIWPGKRSVAIFPENQLPPGTVIKPIHDTHFDKLVDGLKL